MSRFILVVSPILLLAACSQPAEVAEEGIENAASDEMAEAVAPEPAPVIDLELEAWIRENYADMGEILYRSGEADLDGDGNPELLAYIGGPSMCGSGGCNLVALQRTGQGLDVLGDISVAQLPVGVFETSTSGWRDLAVSVSGGGIEGGVAKVPFGEDQYASNPTVAPAEMTDGEFEGIIPLEQLRALD